MLTERKKNTSRATAWLLLAAVLPIGDVMAQSEEAIDEIQVTATRRPLTSTKVSAALSVISSDEITNEKLATDALAAEVGVFLQQTTVGQGAAIIRGLKGSEILHLVDGLRLNNAIFRNAPTQYLALVAPGSVERMEIVRGSPTSLYGSDAVGGVIQVISRLPQFSGDDVEMHREMFVAADSAELGKSARASIDIGNRDVAGLFSASWQESGDRRTGSGARIKPSGFESYSARTALVLNTTEDSGWVFDLQFTRQPETPRVDELVPGFGETEASSSEYFFAPNDRYFAHARHSRDNAWFGANWSMDLGWQRIVDDRRTRNLGSDSRRFEKNRSDLLGLSVNATRDIGSASWVFGTELYHDTVSSERWQRDVNTGEISSRQSRFPDGATIEQAAVFANVSQPVAERHTVSGGLRLSAVDIGLTQTTVSDAADIEIRDFSADIGWLYDLNDTTQIAANLGHGFRAPNIFDLGTLGERPGNRFNIPNPSLESERVTQYDLGVRKRNEDWSLEFVLFQLDYTDKIQSALTGEVTSDGRNVVQSRNLGRAGIYGAEAGLQWRPNERLTAEVIVNYTHGEQRESDGSIANGDRIPPLNGRLSLGWNVDHAWTVRSSLTFADAQTRLSPRDVRDSRINPMGTAGWAIANVEVHWQPGETWSIRAGIDNLLDKRYRVHGSGIDASGINAFMSVRATW